MPEYNWKTDVEPMLAQAKDNWRAERNSPPEARTWIASRDDVAMYFLEVVPPAAMGGGAFATGEPWTHDDRGAPVYLCFRKMDAKANTSEAAYLSLRDLKKIIPTIERW